MTLQNQEKRIRRINYAIAGVILIVIEVLIALFVHDTFIRPYLGDVLVVVVLYVAVRSFLPDGCRLLPLYLFVFAAFVEGLQYLKIVQLLGVENITFLRVLVGSVFDVKDIICYGVGCILLGVYEWKIKVSKSVKGKDET
jgi:hypothetical protein